MRLRTLPPQTTSLTPSKLVDPADEPRPDALLACHFVPDPDPIPILVLVVVPNLVLILVPVLILRPDFASVEWFERNRRRGVAGGLGHRTRR